MSDQNEMKSSEHQEEENTEQEVGILAVEPCCDNGCILTDAANGCSVAEGSGTTANMAYEQFPFQFIFLIPLMTINYRFLLMS
ncbi:MAG: hypothetical protein ACQEWV_28165 [Bacillota bacterium]